MKHLHYESQANKQIGRDNSKTIFMNQFDIFYRNQEYLQPYKKKSDGKMVKLRNPNIIMIKQYQKNHQQANNNYQIETKKLTQIIQAELNIRNKLPNLKKSKSKVITIIDNDGDNEQDHKDEKVQKNEQNLFDLMRLPMILNKNTLLTKSEKNKQKQFLSYIYSQINSQRNLSKQQRQRSLNIKSQKTLNHHEELAMDLKNESKQHKNQHQGLLFPTVNHNKHHTISVSEPKSESKKKKNQIKLSGITVIPTERITLNKQITSLNQSKTCRPKNINLISSQMIHNNPISDVKKSVYQLLVRKVHSSY